MPLFIFENKIECNILKIRNHTHKNIICVLKNNAYEMGTNKIISILKKKGINFFAFEKYNEFIESNLNKNDKVLILESVSKYENKKNLRYSINSVIDAINVSTTSFPLTIHIRIDSGMNRLGLRSIEELKYCLRILESNELINIEGIYTHFSSEVDEYKYFEKQVNMFKKCLKTRHFEVIHANATKSLHKEIIGNYVRVGMGLYGYHQPFLNLLPSLSLSLKPVKIFKPTNLNKIAYSQVPTNKLIGVLPIGYHDANLDSLSFFLKGKKKYSKIGKSCMNHTHFIADEEINYLTWLSIFPTNGIIYNSDDINWYRILASLVKMPKAYLRSKNYDIPKVLKFSKKTSRKSFIRTRSN